jgi:N-acetylmuramoyl-L-alanine amidase
MVYPVHGESGVSAMTAQDAKVQKTGVPSYELDLQGGKRLITVQRGETLSGIARKYQTTIQEIIQINEIRKPDLIKAGQKLWVVVPSVDKPAVEQKERESSLFYLNYVLASSIGVMSKQMIPSVQGDNSINTVDIFVNDEKENRVVAQHDKLSYTLLLEPITTAPIQVSEGTPSPPSRGQGQYTKEDIELLARVIHAEARGEHFLGQVAVGAVVLNRLHDPRFPKTIHSVIYQQGAFTAVIDKQIHLTPDEEAYRAAESAIAGEDPTGGAIYYYNPKTATDRWIKSRPVIKTIGNHTFSI